MSDRREYFGPGSVAVSGTLAPVFDELRRRLDGTWMFQLKVEGEAVLPDGRRVRISRHVGIPATEQIGRRPKRSATV